MPSHAILEYTYGDDYLDVRDAHRAAHLEVAWAAADRGELVLGGAAGSGPFAGVLVFFAEDPVRAAETFARADPYVLNGVVEDWTVRPWTTVVGAGAASPVRPDDL